MPKAGQQQAWVTFWLSIPGHSLIDWALLQLKKLTSQRTVLIFLVWQLILATWLALANHWHRNVSLLSVLTLLPRLHKETQYWFRLAIIAMAVAFSTCFGIIATLLRKPSYMIMYFFLFCLNIGFMILLLHPFFSLECECHQQSYSQCAAVTSFVDRPRHLDTYDYRSYEEEESRSIKWRPIPETAGS